MNERIVCPVCGRENELSSRFCEHCGAALPPPSEAVPAFEQPVASDDAEHKNGRVATSTSAFPPLTPTLFPEYRGEGVTFPPCDRTDSPVRPISSDSLERLSYEALEGPSSDSLERLSYESVQGTRDGQFVLEIEAHRPYFQNYASQLRFRATMSTVPANSRSAWSCPGSDVTWSRRNHSGRKRAGSSSTAIIGFSVSRSEA